MWLPEIKFTLKHGMHCSHYAVLYPPRKRSIVRAKRSQGSHFSGLTKFPDLSSIFTTRKQSLRRLCFYRCLSFCPQVGGGRGEGEGACGFFFDEIRSMSGWYASYWNAFLFFLMFCFLTENLIHFTKKCTVHLNITKNITYLSQFISVFQYFVWFSLTFPVCSKFPDWKMPSHFSSPEWEPW